MCRSLPSATRIILSLVDPLTPGENSRREFIELNVEENGGVLDRECANPQQTPQLTTVRKRRVVKHI